MPAEHAFHSGRTEISLRGQLTPDEVFGAFTGALDDPAAPPAAHLLIDVTASEMLPPQEVLRRIAGIIADRRAGLGGRIAVLVSHEVRYGLARQMGAWLDKSGIQVAPFRDRTKALEWLGVPQRDQGD